MNSEVMKLRKIAGKLLCFLGANSKKFYKYLTLYYGEILYENKIYLVNMPEKYISEKHEILRNLLAIQRKLIFRPNTAFYWYYPKINKFVGFEKIELTNWFPDPKNYAIGFFIDQINPHKEYSNILNQSLVSSSLISYNHIKTMMSKYISNTTTSLRKNIKGFIEMDRNAIPKIENDFQNTSLTSKTLIKEYNSTIQIDGKTNIQNSMLKPNKIYCLTIYGPALAHHRWKSHSSKIRLSTQTSQFDIDLGIKLENPNKYSKRYSLHKKLKSQSKSLENYLDAEIKNSYRTQKLYGIQREDIKIMDSENYKMKKEIEKLNEQKTNIRKLKCKTSFNNSIRNSINIPNTILTYQ